MKGIKAEVVRLDEVCGHLYRHAGECGIEGCDCGAEAIAEQVEKLCHHLVFIRAHFGVDMLEGCPSFVRFLRECEPDGQRVYEYLSPRVMQ